MKKWFSLFLLPILFCCSLVEAAVTKPGAEQPLKEGWLIQSSEQVNAPGEQITSESFRTDGWYAARVPCTILSALVQNGVYRDVYFGKNLETISIEPFQYSWWYRNEFDLEPGIADAQVFRLIFEGINYSANVYLNGKKIRSSDDMVGAFRVFESNVSQLVRKKGNVLAVEIFPPKPGDLTIGFVDWNPTPPDRNMGLWRPVKIRASGAVSIEHPFVDSKVNLESLREARLSVEGTLVNHSAQAVKGKITGKIPDGITFSQEFALAPNEKKDFRFSPDTTSALIIQNPRLWWPNNQGSPELYNLELVAADQNSNLDTRSITFGIREVADYKNEAGHRGYMVNGRKVLIRGAGWVDDNLLQEDEKNLEAQFQYAKHLNLNTVRLEGFWGESQKLYELADRYGLFLMVGFSCQWEWEDYLGKPVDDFGGVKSDKDIQLAVQYMRDQVLWLRHHPSILVWFLASDVLPRPELEKRLRAELARIDPNRPLLASAKLYESEVSGSTGVKMNGPYEYEPPKYWYEDKENGGAFGFNTETSPGAQPPPAESIRRMFSKDHHWPVDDVWNFHCGRNEFNNLNRYMDAFNKRYGEAENLEDFARRAQAANYEAMRPMYEAFGVRKPLATGIVQWMLNASWPKMFWQLYDYYLMPGGAFYGARKANQPLNIAFDYSNRSIHVINDTYGDYSDLKAEAKILSIESKELFSNSVDGAVGPNASRKVLDLPKQDSQSPVTFLSLKLKNAKGEEVANNFYWLSSKQDVLDYEKTDWFYTPIKEYADFTELKKLPPVAIEVESQMSAKGINVTVRNPGPHIAFFIEMKVVGDKTGRSIVPVFWDDNYISLLPGETKQVSARFSQEDLRGQKPVLRYSGWNVGASNE